MVTTKKRRRRLARAKWERRQLRTVQRSRRMRRRSIVTGVVVATLAVGVLIGWMLWPSENGEAAAGAAIVLEDGAINQIIG